MTDFTVMSVDPALGTKKECAEEGQGLRNFFLLPIPVGLDLLLDAGVVHAAGDIKGVAEEVAPLLP